MNTSIFQVPDHLKTVHPDGRGFSLTHSGVPPQVFFCENEAGAERWEAAILKLVEKGLLGEGLEG